MVLYDLKRCSLIHKHANQQPSAENDREVPATVQRLDGEESTNNPSTSAQHLV